jgi:BirA family biotin operon repressor/biotin-[acetyl-CoA-carboxylase] ligase
MLRPHMPIEVFAAQTKSVQMHVESARINRFRRARGLVLTPLGFSLLRQLSDGAFHSGEDLAATVGLTRARVSQLLKQAETAGLALERVRGRGYRLLATPDFLDVKEIRTALEALGVEVAPPDAKAPLLPAANDDDLVAPGGASIPLHPAIAVEVTDQVDSTSTELLRRAARRDIHGAVLAAEWQTAGRGRRGRVWTAVAGGSLTFSLGWRFEQGAGFVAGLSLAVGVAVVRALEAEGLAGVELKWPNDLVHRHLKVGGILVELNGDALGPSTVVVGVGLNIRLPQNVKRDIAQPVSDLATVAGRGAPPIDRNKLLARLVSELAASLSQYAAQGFMPFAAEWQRRHAYQGKPVKLLLPDGEQVKGTVAGVDSTGALVLADGPRRARFLAGEISLRRA